MPCTSLRCDPNDKPKPMLFPLASSSPYYKYNDSIILFDVQQYWATVLRSTWQVESLGVRYYSTVRGRKKNVFGRVTTDAPSSGILLNCTNVSSALRLPPVSE